MELICCCQLACAFKPLLAMTGKMGCLRDIRSLEGAPTSTKSSLGHPVCTMQCSCLSWSLSGMPFCTTALHLPVLLLLVSICHSQPEAKPRRVGASPSFRHLLACQGCGSNHGISFCPRLCPRDGTDISCLYHGERWK